LIAAASQPGYKPPGAMLLAKKLAAIDLTGPRLRVRTRLNFFGGDGKSYERGNVISANCSHLYALVVARNRGTWIGVPNTFGYWIDRLPAGENDYSIRSWGLLDAALRRNRMAAREMVRGLPPELRELYVACLRDYHDQARIVRREHPEQE